MSFPVEASRFSPDSPPPPLRTVSSTFAGSFSDNVPRDVESITSGARTRRETFRDRFTKMFFDFRTLDDRDKEADLVPIQPPQRPLSEWPPLRIGGKHPQQPQVRKEKKFKMWWIILLFIILAYLVGNVIFLNVRIFALTRLTDSSQSPSQMNATPTASPLASSQSLSSTAKECISQFTLNAPSNASSYPCGSCLTALSGVTSSASTQDFQQATNAIQFCGLVGIFKSADSDGQSILSNGGWSENVDFCTWTGVGCDSSGRVSSLELTFPGVPAAFPTELGGLTGMQSFQVVGNGVVPAGSVPSSFQNLTSLKTLHLESTAITTFPNDLFSSLNKVSNLTFVANLNLSADFSSINQLPLQRLIIQHQLINNPLSDLAESSVLQSSLTALDLSWNSFSGTIPSSISSLSSLTELHLDCNNLQSPLPYSFPSNLQILTMTNNTALSGTMPSTFCSSRSLVQCNLRDTSLNGTGGCGVCQF